MASPRASLGPSASLASPAPALASAGGPYSATGVLLLPPLHRWPRVQARACGLLGVRRAERERVRCVHARDSMDDSHDWSTAKNILYASNKQYATQLEPTNSLGDERRRKRMSGRAGRQRDSLTWPSCVSVRSGRYNV